MINFACLVPHPPSMIAEIGNDKSIKYSPTIKSLQYLSQKIAEKEPESIIVITPHGPYHPEKINISGSPKLYGGLADFGANLEFEFDNDLKLATEIYKKANKNGIPTALYRPTETLSRLDSGVLAPLYYLLDEIGSVKIIPITYSQIDRNYLFAFGELIGETAKKSEKSIGIIASGDLSHKLLSPIDSDAQLGKEFDLLLTQYLKEKDIRSIVEINPEILDRSGECAYNSLMILLGAISYYQWQPEVLSYQAPYGIGHLVTNFEIQEEK